MDEIGKEVTEALERMIYVWENCPRYDSSKSDWENHYQAALNVQRLYRENMERFIDDETTPYFMMNLHNHINRLEVYRDYGLLVNP